MTKDEQRDIVLNFFKERGQEMKDKLSRDFYVYETEFIELNLVKRLDGRYSLYKYLANIDEIEYKIFNLPTDPKELNVLLNILNPLQV